MNWCGGCTFESITTNLTAVTLGKPTTMKKEFIHAQQLLVDSYLLADTVIKDDFVPNFIIGVWRGGAPIGIAIQEYFDYKNISTDHICVRTSAYKGINQSEKLVTVDGLDYLLEKVQAHDRLLIVDDVFDTGKSIDALITTLESRLTEVPSSTKMPIEIRIAVPWFKPNNNVTNRIPDYFLHQSNDWLVFPHEIKGLTLDEIKTHKSDLGAVNDLFIE